MKGLVASVLSSVCLLAVAAIPVAAQPSGSLELRITDHRPGIADFRWLEVTVGDLAIHRKGEGRKTGWVDLVEIAPAIDIVPLKDGLWRPLATVDLPVGDYDALRVRFAGAAGELLNSSRPEVRTDDTVVRFDLTVRPDAVQPLVLDLYAEDLTDHEPQHYVVRVKEVRLDRPGDRPAGVDGQRS